MRILAAIAQFIGLFLWYAFVLVGLLIVTFVSIAILINVAIFIIPLGIIFLIALAVYEKLHNPSEAEK